MERKLVVVAGDDIGREVIPLATTCLRAALPALRVLDAEAGWEHMWRTGRAIDRETVEMVRRAGAALIGPERSFSQGTRAALDHLIDALDLCGELYPFRNRDEQIDLLLLVESSARLEAERGFKQSFSPFQAWSATRLGNLAGLLARRREGRVVLAHDSEEPFAHALTAGVEGQAHVERLDALFFVNHFDDLVREFDLIVTSARTSRLLFPLLTRQEGSQAQLARLLLGPRAAVATPGHGPLTEQVGWGFANPLGAIQAGIALLRYWWNDERAASRLEGAIERAVTRRRTPDMGGLHTMLEVTRAILQEMEQDKSGS